MTIVIFTLYLLSLGFFTCLRNVIYIIHMLIVATFFYALNDQDSLNHITSYSVTITLSIHFLSINAATYYIYKLDKKLAKKREWRVPEKTLHAFAFMGGIPGALIARKILRHKTAKKPFIREFWGVAILQLAFIGSLLYFLSYFDL